MEPTYRNRQHAGRILGEKLAQAESKSVPLGHGAIRAAKGLGSNVTLDLVGDYVYGGWGFPAELWGKERQLWTEPRERIMDWTKSLR